MANKDATAELLKTAAPRPLELKVDQLIGLVPFLPASIIKDGDGNGVGIWKIVTVAANADLTIKHYLGYIPHFCMAFDNGTAFTPKVKRSATAWTTTAITVQFDGAASNCLVWIL